MSDTSKDPIEDYEIIEGYHWSDLTDPLTCETVENYLQHKIDDITSQLDASFERFEATGQSDPSWRINARYAMNATKNELRKVRVHRATLKQAIREKNAEQSRLALEEARAAKLHRIALSRSDTDHDLLMFKEEVKRRITAAEYDDIWRSVRGAQS